jgi:hypothetical protein
MKSSFSLLLRGCRFLACHPIALLLYFAGAPLLTSLGAIGLAGSLYLENHFVDPIIFLSRFTALLWIALVLGLKAGIYVELTFESYVLRRLLGRNDGWREAWKDAVKTAPAFASWTEVAKSREADDGGFAKRLAAIAAAVLAVDEIALGHAADDFRIDRRPAEFAENFYYLAFVPFGLTFAYLPIATNWFDNQVWGVLWLMGLEALAALACVVLMVSVETVAACAYWLWLAWERVPFDTSALEPWFPRKEFLNW